MKIMLFFPYYFIEEMSLFCKHIKAKKMARFTAFQFVGLKHEDSYFGHYSWN